MKKIFQPIETFLVIMTFIVLISCKNKSNIESVYVIYYNYCFESHLPIKCDDIYKKNLVANKSIVILNDKNDSIGLFFNNHSVLDTLITEKEFLSKIENELSLLVEDTIANHEVDARISCEIRFKDGTKSKLCIGEYLAEDIQYNGKRQKSNNNLLYLIKSTINYYKWMPKDYLIYEPELNDTSIKTVHSDIYNK